MMAMRLIPLVFALCGLCVSSEYHDVGPDISPWTYSNIQRIQSLEERINQYRRFIIHLFGKLPGSCDLLRIFDDYSTPRYLDNSPDIQHLMEKLQPTSAEIHPGNPTPDPKKTLLDVLEIYLDFTAYVLDPVSTEGIERSLRRSCASDGDHLASDKRSDEKVVGKKIKFHSWGGKRHQLNLDSGYRIITRTPFHSWGGKRASPDSTLYNDFY